MNRFLPVCLSLLVVFSPQLIAQEKRSEVLSQSSNFDLDEAAYRLGLMALTDEERMQLRDNPTMLLKFALRLHSNAALANQAEQAGLSKDARIQALIARARDNILMTAYMQKVRDDLERPDLARLAKERYLATRESFRTDERRRVAHILLTDISVCPCEVEPPEDAIKALKTELDEGADFETMAKEKSHDLRTRPNGGELGWLVQNGEMPLAFENTIFSLKKPGDISAPVKTKFGWHIVKLLEIDPSIIPPFEKVKSRIERQLWNEIQSNALEQARSSNYPLPDDVNIDAIADLVEQVDKELQESNP